MAHTKQTPSTASRITSIIGAVLFAVVLLCIGSVLVTKYLFHQPANLFGIRIIKIITPSMEPTIGAGDYILVKNVAGKDVKENDIVVHIPASGPFAGAVMTHRCVKAPYYDAEMGEECIHTRGDRKGAPLDAPVPIKNVQSVWVYTFHISRLFDFVTSIYGILILVAIPALALIVAQLVNMIKSLKAKPDAEAVQKEADRIVEERYTKLAQDAVDQYLQQKQALEFLIERKILIPHRERKQAEQQSKACDQEVDSVADQDATQPTEPSSDAPHD